MSQEAVPPWSGLSTDYTGAEALIHGWRQAHALHPKPDGRQRLVVRIPHGLMTWVRSEAYVRGMTQHEIVTEALDRLREAG